jgi:hypothetical protein
MNDERRETSAPHVRRRRAISAPSGRRRRAWILTGAGAVLLAPAIAFGGRVPALAWCGAAGAGALASGVAWLALLAARGRTRAALLYVLVRLGFLIAFLGIALLVLGLWRMYRR